VYLTRKSLFVVRDHGSSAILDGGATPQFRHLLERSCLAQHFLATIVVLMQACGLLIRCTTAIGTTIILLPRLTRNRTGRRDPEMHQTKKGTRLFSDMKALIRVDAGTRLVHTGVGTDANVHDVN